MASGEIARQNQLLRGLSGSALERVAADLQLRAMHVRDRVAEPVRPVEDVYFPLNCVLSTVAEGASGDAVEVATIGNEGMAGISVFLGVDTSGTLQTFAQVGGNALTMRAREFRAHLQSIPRLMQIMGAYTQALLTQIAQSSACNRLHPVEERYARWLLMTHDRVVRDEFELTQEFMAQMLGVRRATVGEEAAALQEARIIQYARGVVSILDRAALEERSCECYRIIRDEYARLLPPRPECMGSSARSQPP
jgi:CRP-like cAMP-binding protein